MRRRLVTILGLTAVAVAAGLVAATPAQAVTGIQVVEATSATDSVAIKSVTANCPAGGVVYGGGGLVDGGAGGGTGHDVRLSGLRPMVNLLGLSGFRATATEDETGYASDWAVRAFAICGPKLPGYQVIWQTSPSSSDSSRSATATCPGGKKVISAGAEVINGGDDVVLQLIVPNNHLEWVAANAYEDQTGYNGNWQLTAYAVCANSLLGLELVVETSPVGEGPSTYAQVECPDGKELLGLGGHAFGGVPSFGELYLVFVYGFQGDPWSAIVLGVEDETGFATGWFVGAYAICAY
jgi:hypothetical protein